MEIRGKEVKVGQKLVCVADVEVLGDVQVEVGEIVEVLDFDDKNCKFTMNMGFGVGSHEEMNDHFAVVNLQIDDEEDDWDYEDEDEDCLDYDDYYNDEDEEDECVDPKFKVGDIVKVKKSVAHKTRFGGCSVVNDMREFAGKKVEIIVVDDTGVGESDVRYKIKGCRYNFTSDMFKDKVYNEDRDEPKFKRGDKVKVVSENGITNYFKVGYIAEIEDYDDGDYLCLVGTRRQYVSECDLELYKETDEEEESFRDTEFKVGDIVVITKREANGVRNFHNFDVGEIVKIIGGSLSKHTYNCENGEGKHQHVPLECFRKLERDVEENEVEHNFKVGDKVRIINDGSEEYFRHCYYIGDIVEIVRVYKDGTYECTNAVGVPQLVKRKSFELYTEENEETNSKEDIEEYVSYLIETSKKIGFEYKDNKYVTYIELSNGVRIEEILDEELVKVFEINVEDGTLEDAMFEILADKLTEMERYRQEMNDAETDKKDYKVIDCNVCTDCPECNCEDNHEEDEKFSDYYSDSFM